MKANIVSLRKQRNVTTYVTASLLMLLPCVALSQEAKAPAEPAQVAKDDPLEAIVLKKLSTIIIPVIAFEDVSFEEAFDFLRTRARFNFVIRKPQAAANADANVAIISALQLRNVSLLSALKYCCLLTNQRLSVEEGVVVITPKKEGDKEVALPVDPAAKERIEKSLNTLIIPKIDFEDISIDEALDYLRAKTREGDPNKHGVNFVIVKPLDKELTRIAKMKLKSVSAATILKQICEATNLEYTVDEAAVILTPKK